MGWLKKLFSKEVKEVEETQVVYSMKIPERKSRICKMCNSEIKPEQKYSKKLGYYFHRDCWKKARNDQSF
jgi:hypothetical protein